MSSAGTRDYLLAFADDEHLMGQQHTEWVGIGPFLEEDLAFSSIGQDELGHAALLYELVLELDGTECSAEAIDALAYHRAGSEYRSCHLVERTTVDWGEALVRHWIYDTCETMRWQLVADSTLPQLRAIARRALREEEFHRRHADALLDVLLAAPDARERLVAALEALGPLVFGLCEPVAGEADAIREGVCRGSSRDLVAPLTEAIAARFEHEPRTLGAANGHQSLRTVRSADFEPRLARMREVFDFDPEAKW